MRGHDMDYPGWTVETTHPVDEADPDYCAQCSGMVAPTMAHATSWAVSASQAQETDDMGNLHTVVVRQV